MEQFPDGIHVRLRARSNGGYLYADEDGVGVSRRGRRSRASLRTAWRVHHHVRGTATLVMLHGAAYGRYLALSPQQAPPGHRGLVVVQRDCDEPVPDAVLWRVFRPFTAVGNDVAIAHAAGRRLRVNGRHRFWITGVTAQFHATNDMAQWRVEAIPPRQEAPPIPAPTPNLLPSGGFIGRFHRHRRTQPMPAELRTIRYVRADDFGNFNNLGWQTFQFYGRSVFNLRSELTIRLGEGFVSENIIVCNRAGRHGRLTPLITDLPFSEEAMDIVVLTVGSPASAELRYPDVDAH